jgi:hypothetical protein
MNGHIDRQKFMKQSLTGSTGATPGSVSLTSLLRGNFLIAKDERP